METESQGENTCQQSGGQLSTASPGLVFVSEQWVMWLGLPWEGTDMAETLASEGKHALSFRGGKGVLQLKTG